MWALFWLLYVTHPAKIQVDPPGSPKESQHQDFPVSWTEKKKEQNKTKTTKPAAAVVGATDHERGNCKESLTSFLVDRF